MPSYQPVNTQQFDAALQRLHERDEHDFLESRFFDRNGRLFAKVIRYQDEDGVLKPEADLLLLEELISS